MIVASTRWSMMHDLAILIIDGHLGVNTKKVSDADLEITIKKVLELELADNL